MITYKLFAFSLVVTLAYGSFAQGIDVPTQNKSSTDSSISTNVLYNDVEIQKDDADYRAIRKEIESAFANTNPKLSHVDVINIYKKKYFSTFSKKPDKIALYGFGWLYASYYREQLESHHPTPEMREAIRNVAQMPIPAVYDYVRLRFIIQQMVQRDESLRLLGERLLKMNPHDFGVEYQLARMTDPSKSTKDRELSINYIEDLVKVNPDRSSAWAIYSHSYHTIWIVTHSLEYLKKSVYGFKKYASIAGNKADPYILESGDQIIKELERNNHS